MGEPDDRARRPDLSDSGFRSGDVLEPGGLGPPPANRPRARRTSFFTYGAVPGRHRRARRPSRTGLPGWIVLVDEAETTLWTRLRREPVATRTGEVLLAQRGRRARSPLSSPDAGASAIPARGAAGDDQLRGPRRRRGERATASTSTTAGSGFSRPSDTSGAPAGASSSRWTSTRRSRVSSGNGSGPGRPSSPSARPRRPRPRDPGSGKAPGVGRKAAEGREAPRRPPAGEGRRRLDPPRGRPVRRGEPRGRGALGIQPGGAPRNDHLRPPSSRGRRRRAGPGGRRARKERCTAHVTVAGTVR